MMRFTLIEIAIVAFVFLLPLSLLVFVQVTNVISGKTTKERFGKSKIKKIDESTSESAKSKQFVESLIIE